MTEIAIEDVSVNRDERKSWGKKLLVAAWIVEIIAAIIGLLVAWSMGIQTYQVYTENGVDLPTGKWFDILLAGLPFMMVASVELLKIPFSYLVYTNKNRRIKAIFGVVLVLVTFITFETLSIGFERQYANITTQVDIPRNKLAVTDKKINYIESELSKLKAFSSESISNEVNTRIEIAKSSRDEDIKNLEKEKISYISSGNSVYAGEIESIKSEIIRLEETRDKKIADLEKFYNDKASQDNENEKERLNTNTNRIKSLEEEKNTLRKMISAKEESLGALGAFFSNDIPKWEKKIDEIDKEIKDIRSEKSIVSGSSVQLRIESNVISKEYYKDIDIKRDRLNKLNLEIARNTQYKSEITAIDTRIRDRREKYSNEIADIDSYRKSENNKLQEKYTRIDKLDKELLPLKSEQLELENTILAAYQNTQIYRLARGFYGIERGVLITEKEIAFVAKLWFGSLAGIVASMGIFLAFGAFILRDPSVDTKARLKRNSPIKRSFRLMFRALRKRFKEPKIVTKKVEVAKEVIKEVPVDKVVMKEIPVEVVRKEVIHVPIYTNDPDLLKFGTTKVKDIMDDE